MTVAVGEGVIVGDGVGDGVGEGDDVGDGEGVIAGDGVGDGVRVGGIVGDGEGDGVGDGVGVGPGVQVQVTVTGVRVTTTPLSVVLPVNVIVSVAQGRPEIVTLFVVISGVSRPVVGLTVTGAVDFGCQIIPPAGICIALKVTLHCDIVP